MFFPTSVILKCFSYFQTKVVLLFNGNLRFAFEAKKPTDLTSSFCPFLLEVRRLFGRVGSSVSPDSAKKVFQMLSVKVAEVLVDVINGTSFKYVVKNQLCITQSA